VRVYTDGNEAFEMWPGGWSSVPDAFLTDANVTDHQTAIVGYANGVHLSFHSNSMTSLRERRWYVAGTEGTLIADLVRNTLMWRRTMETGAPYRKQFSVSESDHNGADVAMARDLIATLANEAEYPVSPFQAIEAGLTVMAIDKAQALNQVVDCTAMWTTLDAAMGAA
jgi:predicted dehydrogenase